MDFADLDLPENRASLAPHHSRASRTLGVRERIAQHHGVWRDAVFLERRTAGELPVRLSVVVVVGNGCFGMPMNSHDAIVPGATRSTVPSQLQLQAAVPPAPQF